MTNSHSFARLVKEEICTTSFDTQRQKAILASFIKAKGTISFQGSESILTLETTNNKVVKLIYRIIHDLYGIDPVLQYEKLLKLNKNTMYVLTINSQVDGILSDLSLGILDDVITEQYYANDNVYGGYLAGTFLAVGSLNSPLSTNYHLEFSFKNTTYAAEFKNFLWHVGKHTFAPKSCERRGQIIVYLKRSDQIANCLVHMGAVDACMEFENIRVDRDFKNSAHRLEMCDLANIKKSINAGEEQVRIINFLGLENIRNDKAHLVALTRLANPEASLVELIEIIEEEHDTSLTKSNVNHIFRALKSQYLDSGGSE